jgi:photosystem II stability/assembly factor-like uncharacterized protein
VGTRSTWTIVVWGLLLAVLVFVPGSAGAGISHDWQWVNPLPQGQGLEDFSVVNSQVIYAVGDGGSMVKSDDGGISWQALATGTTAWLLGVDFTDELTGTTVGEVNLAGIILRTTDGGQTWLPQGNSPLPWLEAVDFWDANTGVIVGWSGAIYWTSDGGATWVPQDSGTTQRLYSVHLFDATTAIAVGGDGVICRTRDAGESWYHPPSNTEERLEAVDFGGAVHGAAVGRNGTAIYSYDGGEAWSPRVSGTGEWLDDVTFRDEYTAVAVGIGGTLIVSTNGGINWSPLDPPASGGWNAVDFTTGGGILLTGGVGSLWRSDDSWSTWENGQTGATGGLLSIDKATSSIAVAVGYKGTLLRTQDAGLTWTEINSGCDTTFLGVDFAGVKTALAVGHDGYILRSDDTGLTWSPLTTGWSNDLWDVACIDSDHAVAVGESRTIFRTEDAGMTWHQVGPASGLDYYQAVYFVDDLHGWISTFYGEILHTFDGGLNWEIQVSTYLDLQDIFFTDLLHGISVGGVDGNATLLTDDGGLTWTEQPNPEYAYLNGVRFSDQLTGIAVGDGIFRTFDGAVTWQRDFTASSLLADICLMGEGVALAVGRGGTIMRAGPDGVGIVFEGPPQPGLSMQAYPNPFNPRTTVAFFLPRQGHVQIGVFDLSGRQVRTLAAGAFPRGDHKLEWNGRDDDGRALASGSYLVRCQTDLASRTQRVMLIR